jgi:hypothetical protein
MLRGPTLSHHLVMNCAVHCRRPESRRSALPLGERAECFSRRTTAQAAQRFLDRSKTDHQ